jgi:hypothetical protein
MCDVAAAAAHLACAVIGQKLVSSMAQLHASLIVNA